MKDIAMLKRARLFSLIFLIALHSLLLPTAGAAVTYSDSAHGDTAAGVDRLGLPDYARGNCAHCHEQHGSVGGSEPDPVGGTAYSLLLSATNTASLAPYSVTDNACFQCHSDSSLQYGGIVNHDYSGTFAGYLGASGTGGASPDNIMAAFNKNHSHDLNDIHDYAAGNGPYSRPADFPGFSANSNPCTACHNPHLAKRNKANPIDRSLSVMSMPDDHDNLYGLNAGESIDAWYSGSMTPPGYIAPYDEPAGGNTPDYNSFCLYCHQHRTPTALRTRHLDGASVSYFEAIDWTTEGNPDGDGNQSGTYLVPGDKHGVNMSTGYAAVEPPYDINVDGSPADVALACMNCHEAHGSENDYMHRRSLNGTPLGVVITGVTNQRGFHCLPCHTEDAGGNKWKDTHHGGGFSNDNPYRARTDRNGDGDDRNDCDYCHGSSSASSADFPIPCEDCHFHGSYVDENDKYVNPDVKYIKPDFAPFRRKTF